MHNVLTIAIFIFASIYASRTPVALANPVDKNGPTLNQKVTLLNNIEVNRHFVKIRDIFRNTGDKAEIEIAYAPQPGKRLVFDARWLFWVARKYKLSWRPLSNRVKVVVTRQSDIIERTEIKELLLYALIEKGASPQSDIILSNKIRQLYVPSGMQDKINIQDIQWIHFIR